ncbi:MAG: hypothetical protein Q8M02_04865 [Candidatus Didemnitutus sp.]|nr:hypothetical protein [Candidatus Didemnitutus sp.]
MDLTNVNAIRASVLPLQEHIEAVIGMVTDRMKDEAHPDGNMGWLQDCAKEVDLMKRDLRALEAIREHLIEVLTNTLSFEDDDISVSKTGMRTLTVEVSQGMINQHLLTLTGAKKKGQVKEGEKFTIQLPEGTSFHTELCEPGNKIRERGLIRKFYESEKITDGDKVIMCEVSRGTWKILAAKSPEGQELESRLLKQRLDQLSDILGEKPLTPTKTP